VPSALLVAGCVFGIFYSAPVSYSWMTFFVTVMAGSLYGLFGVLRPGLLALRLAETGWERSPRARGAAGTAVTTHAATDAWIRRALHAVRDFTAQAARHLEGGPGEDLARRAAELDLVLGRVRASVAPLCIR